MSNMQNMRFFSLYYVKNTNLWKKKSSDVCDPDGRLLVEVTSYPRHVQDKFRPGLKARRKDTFSRQISVTTVKLNWRTNVSCSAPVTVNKFPTAAKKQISQKAPPVDCQHQRGSQRGVTVRNNLKKEKKSRKVQTKLEISRHRDGSAAPIYNTFFWY